MDSIELIRANLERSRDRVLSKVEEMRGHELVRPTPRGGAHTLWTLGHLAYIEGLVVARFMLGEAHPLAGWEDAFDGADVSDDPSAYPAFDDVLRSCRAMRAATLDRVGGYVEADLDVPSVDHPEGTDEMFGTRRECLQFVADHWYMHRGQLADARRASGIDRMWF